MIRCLQAALEPFPFLLRNDAGDDVERNDPLAALLVAVDVERDAELDHRAVGGPLAADEVVGRHHLHAAEEGLAVAARLALAVEHFVVEAVRLVLGKLELSHADCRWVRLTIASLPGDNRRLFTKHVDRSSGRSRGVFGPGRWQDRFMSLADTENL